MPGIRPPVLRAALVALLAATAVLAGRQLPAADPAVDPLPVGNRTAAEFPGLHNVFRLSEKLYNGSAPEGEPGFQSLQRLGIRTILTVDGARPDVETARKYGMRYVHIPIGYDGCLAPQANRIVRAVRDLPGPIYIHCHHGKHRSPAAAAFARIALDGLSNAEAVREMEWAGTGKNYVGLYGAIRAYRPPTPAELERIRPEFPEIAPTPPMMEAMVRIEQRFEGLMRCQKEGWGTPKDHPDLVPALEALQLRELFTELNRIPEVRQRPADFQRWMRDSEQAARALEGALRAGNRMRADMLLGRVAAACGACHAKYRNVPQGR